MSIKGCVVIPVFTNMSCRLLVIGLMSCWILNAGALLAEQQVPAPTHAKKIRFGALQGIYPNVSRKDGRLALEFLMQKTIVRNAYSFTVELSFIDQGTDIPDAIERGGYHFITLSSIDYFKYRNSVHLNPILTPSKIESPTDRLLFIVRKDQDLSTIWQKAHRSLIIETGSSGDLSKIWLDTLLLAQGFPRSKQFFTAIRRANKPGRAIIPVFLNQADACVITQQALDITSELNPQIQQRVKALYQSKRLIQLMICATDKTNQNEIDTFVREATDMGNNPDAHQAMAILQIKNFLRIFPEDLVATEALLRRHGKIQGSHNKSSTDNRQNNE